MALCAAGCAPTRLSNDVAFLLRCQRWPACSRRHDGAYGRAPLCPDRPRRPSARPLRRFDQPLDLFHGQVFAGPNRGGGVVMRDELRGHLPTRGFPQNGMLPECMLLLRRQTSIHRKNKTPPNLESCLVNGLRSGFVTALILPTIRLEKRPMASECRSTSAMYGRPHRPAPLRTFQETMCPALIATTQSASNDF